MAHSWSTFATTEFGQKIAQVRTFRIFRRTFILNSLVSCQTARHSQVRVGLCPITPFVRRGIVVFIVLAPTGAGYDVINLDTIYCWVERLLANETSAPLGLQQPLHELISWHD